LQQEAVRMTKADALSPASGGPLDLMIASTVPITSKLTPSATSKRAVYRAHLKNGQIAGLFSDCPSQRVKPIDDQTVELTVVAVRPPLQPEASAREATHKPEAQARGPAAGNPASSPNDADVAPSSFIQSGDPLIQQMAAQATMETDPWKIAYALESFVQRTVKNKNYSQAFATAADVARTLEGDCTEHALLLAALCRARKIPARAAFGLIYYPPKRGFAYHMWTEVWIKDRWVPMDATLGLGGIGADHIKLGDSNFSGSSPLTDLLSVVQVLGRLELDVLSVE
jgi:transglutaminase-like putative cysteine protease